MVERMDTVSWTSMSISHLVVEVALLTNLKAIQTRLRFCSSARNGLMKIFHCRTSLCITRVTGSCFSCMMIFHLFLLPSYHSVMWKRTLP